MFHVRKRWWQRKGKYLLLVVTDGELQVTRDDTLLLVVARRITRKLENLSSEVLQDGSEVDCKQVQARLVRDVHVKAWRIHIPGAPAPTRWA